MIVMNWHFDASKTRRMNFSSHFNANHTTVLFECDLLKHRSSDESEVTINVSERQTKQHLDGVMVDTTDNDTVEWI